MITLNGYPRNKDKVRRLIEFFKEILDILNALDVTPVLDGSLAAFAYTGDQTLLVNDVDLSCPEAEFLRIIDILKEQRIGYQLKEWHVLQILRDDLKIDLGSIEYWYRDLPMDCEILKIDNYKIRMLSLNSLCEFYRRGMEDRAKKTEENEKIKYKALKEKYDALNKFATLGKSQEEKRTGPRKN